MARLKTLRPLLELPARPLLAPLAVRRCSGMQAASLGDTGRTDPEPGRW